MGSGHATKLSHIRQEELNQLCMNVFETVFPPMTSADVELLELARKYIRMNPDEEKYLREIIGPEEEQKELVYDKEGN
jgi:hypothetical protein